MIVSTLLHSIDRSEFADEVERYKHSAGFRRKIARRLRMPRGLTESAALAYCLQCFQQEWALLCRGVQFSAARMRAAIIYILANT